MWGRDTDCTDEKGSFLLDNNIEELIELPFLIVVLVAHVSNLNGSSDEGRRRTFVLRALPPTCGMRRSTPKGALGSFKSALSALIWILLSAHILEQEAHAYLLP